MYELILLLHSYLRWIVLALALLSFATAASGWLGQRTWRASDEQRHQGFIMALNLQFLLGLLLYVVLSPTTQEVFSDFSGAMANRVLRFWGVEHTTMMFLAVFSAHAGKAVSARRKGIDRHMPMAIGLIVFAIFLFAGFPWPGAEHGRPFFRGLP